MIDAANACVFVRARDLGLTGRELPEELERDPALLERLQSIRRQASIAMGIARDDAEARTVAAVPIIGFVAPPMDAPTLSGEPIAAAQVDLTARFLSNGQPHRALPLTASLCTAVAANIAGTLVAEALAPGAGRAGADRHAVGHPDRGRRGRPGRRRPVGGAQRRVLPHREAAVRRPHLRAALGLFRRLPAARARSPTARPVRRARPGRPPSRWRRPAIWRRSRWRRHGRGTPDPRPPPARRG